MSILAHPVHRSTDPYGVQGRQKVDGDDADDIAEQRPLQLIDRQAGDKRRRAEHHKNPSSHQVEPEEAPDRHGCVNESVAPKEADAVDVLPGRRVGDPGVQCPHEDNDGRCCCLDTGVDEPRFPRVLCSMDDNRFLDDPERNYDQVQTVEEHLVAERTQHVPGDRLVLDLPTTREILVVDDLTVYKARLRHKVCQILREVLVAIGPDDQAPV